MEGIPVMDVPERDKHEAELARVLGRLMQAQMGRLLELMGDPPKIENVPQSFWDETGIEFSDTLRPFMERLYLTQAGRLMEEAAVTVSWSLINKRAADWAKQYTFDLVRGIVDTTRTILQDAVSSYFTDGLTIGELEDAILPAFGASRAEMIAVTEVTRASSQGEVALVEELRTQGIEMTEIWQTNVDELVCDICAPNNGKRKGDGWSEEPPAHPRCRCWINLELPKG